MSTATRVIGVIGCGRMGSAIAAGVLDRNPSVTLRLFDSKAEAMVPLKKRANAIGMSERVQICGSAPEVLQGAEVVILAVKPSGIVDVLMELRYENTSCLLVSVAAGLEMELLRRVAGEHRVVRVMPNTPSLVGEGVTAVLSDALSREEDVATVQALFASIGDVETVPSEELMHVVTGISGSGPAFVALIVEAMADAGVTEGLGRECSLRLARQTMRGTTALLRDLHPALLKDGVASPGGTTAAGLAEAEVQGLRGSVIQTIRAAVRRSREMAAAPRPDEG